MATSKGDREYRSFDLSPVKDDDSKKYVVRGRAATFEPYVLWEENGIQYKEQIDKNAFASCDMSDVVFRVDHRGAVYARTSASTLLVTVDDYGLNFEADLSKTENSRGIYEDLAAGNYPQASFAFVVEADSYDALTHTRIITAFKKIFDVSPVTFPANPGTEVFAVTRDYFSAQEEAIKKAKHDAAAARLALRLRLD